MPYSRPIAHVLLVSLLAGAFLGPAHARGGGGRAPAQTTRTLALTGETPRLTVTARPGDTLRLTFFEDTLNDPRRWRMTLPPGTQKALVALPTTRQERGDHGYAVFQLDGTFTLRVRGLPGAGAPVQSVQFTFAAPQPLDADQIPSYPARDVTLTVNVTP